MCEVLVDPRVSRAKFDREIRQYRELEPQLASMGWWLVRAEFPEVVVVFGAIKTGIPVVVLSARLDFSNYDLWPPSVTLIHPFTRVPYKAKELPNALLRRIPVPHTGTREMSGPTGTTAVPDVRQYVPQPMMQSWQEDDVPFLCLPGVREYHDSPAHTGDSWLLRRGKGEGTLHFILSQLYKYGVQPIRLATQTQIGLQIPLQEIPE